MKAINKDNTSCVVVSYNPNEDNIYNLIVFLSKTFSEVCLVDNNSINYLEFKSKIEPIGNNVKIIHNDCNIGIASALNIGIRYLKKDGIDWIITFDQDSLPIDNFVGVYNSILVKENNLGLLCPGFTNKSSDLMKNGDEVQYTKSLDLISSGMLHNVEIFDSVGYYNEPMFIDYVDFEYTLRVARRYDTFKCYNNTLFHIIGDPLEGTILGRKIHSSNHSPIRRYYKSRNLVYVYRLWHKSYPQWTKEKLDAHIKSIIPLILLEKNKFRKLSSIVRGLCDGITFQRK